MALPACVFAPDAAHSEPDLAFCAASSAAKQVMVDAGLGCISIKIRLVILMSNFIDCYFNPRENELAQ
jgi:hypothetical protein